MQHRISPSMIGAAHSYRRLLGWYLSESAYTDMLGKPGVIDLAFGDPHEYPTSEMLSVLQRSHTPQHENWFAYLRDDVTAQERVAANLSVELGVGFEPDDIFVTAGAFAGLATALRSICHLDDEVVYLSPTWFYYEPMIVAAGATPRCVQLSGPNWELDLDAIEAAVTERTAAVIVNSPNNPTGVIYSDDQLAALAECLRAASARYERPIYLVSDEAYRRIVFDDLPVPSPARWYANTIVVHTYTKTLLLPGERIGYLAIPETMPDRVVMREALMISRLVGGWQSPNNNLQYVMPELDAHRIPLGPLRARRDRLATAFQVAGFRVRPTKATFYLLIEAPTPDDWAYSRQLEAHNLLVLPGSVMGAPGHLRISLTITDAMVDQVVKRLAEAYPVGTAR
ncbi:aminotransferase class I/II-fold pyridoxal phosphate-dependent enzyme [Nonomuraea sp. NPDC050556]|uniref:aminotransferase class I/II-fold pyridoxal phosphate-dependent enzyme n=1 Tax=Nonomuraea sp. NPDC050556 TaxID=3364369 RepID=UPI0037A19BC7